MPFRQLFYIILLMSLLTSPHTTRQQHKFFNKMQREFNKRSFYNSNYSEPINLLQKVNDNTEKSQELIKMTMQSFLSQLKGIIADSYNTRIDYYFILSQMKNTDFFSEVAALITQDLVNRMNKLERDNFRLKEQIKKALQKIRQIERSEPKEQKNNDIFRFNGIKSISENLYEKAKTLSEEQFIQLCNKAILGDKVVIKKVSDTDTYRKWQDMKLQKIEQKEIMKRIDAFIQDKNKTTETDELAKLIVQLKTKITQNTKPQRCSNPCCQLDQEPVPIKFSKATLIRRSNQAKKRSHVYKSDRSEQYFNRYYRKSQFDIKKITSVEKTKLEQMQKIEDDYRVNLKHRKKNHSLLSR